VNIAIASRQAYQFRGGSGGGGAGGGVGGGGASKEWLQELARERNKVALPRILANEWGVRLPNERFVLSGQSWGLRNQWSGEGGPLSEDDEDDDEEGNDDVMEGMEGQKKDKEGESGGLDEFLGDDMGDEDMDEME
jgi:transcription initiation factor TFIID subunit 9B